MFDPTFHPIADPWVALTAVALQTSRIRLGTMITPLARRRPWKVARETVSLDQVSNGRFILGVGLGDPAQWDYGFFGEEPNAKIRAAKLDESLDIITGLWSGQPFRYQGEHYTLQEVRFLPRTLGKQAQPLWVSGSELIYSVLPQGIEPRDVDRRTVARALLDNWQKAWSGAASSGTATRASRGSRNSKATTPRRSRRSSWTMAAISAGTATARSDISRSRAQ